MTPPIPSTRRVAPIRSRATAVTSRRKKASRSALVMPACGACGPIRPPLVRHGEAGRFGGVAVAELAPELAFGAPRCGGELFRRGVRFRLGGEDAPPPFGLAPLEAGVLKNDHPVGHFCSLPSFTLNMGVGTFIIAASRLEVSIGKLIVAMNEMADTPAGHRRISNMALARICRPLHWPASRRWTHPTWRSPAGR